MPEVATPLLSLRYAYQLPSATSVQFQGWDLCQRDGREMARARTPGLLIIRYYSLLFAAIYLDFRYKRK